MALGAAIGVLDQGFAGLDLRLIGGVGRLLRRQFGFGRKRIDD